MMICCIEEDKILDKADKTCECQHDDDDLSILYCRYEYMNTNTKDLSGNTSNIHFTDNIQDTKIKSHLISVDIEKNKKYFLSKCWYDIVYNIQATYAGSFNLQTIKIGRNDKIRDVNIEDVFNIDKLQPDDIFLISDKDTNITYNSITFSNHTESIKRFMNMFRL